MKEGIGHLGIDFRHYHRYGLDKINRLLDPMYINTFLFKRKIKKISLFEYEINSFPPVYNKETGGLLFHMQDTLDALVSQREPRFMTIGVSPTKEYSPDEIHITKLKSEFGESEKFAFVTKDKAYVLYNDMCDVDGVTENELMFVQGKILIWHEIDKCEDGKPIVNTNKLHGTAKSLAIIFHYVPFTDEEIHADNMRTLSKGIMESKSLQVTVLFEKEIKPVEINSYDIIPYIDGHDLLVVKHGMRMWWNEDRYCVSVKRRK